MSEKRIIALLLAGGQGRRFDPSGELDKLLARVDGIPVVVRAAASLRDCDQRIAVLGLDKPLLGAALEAAGCELVLTEATRMGLGHSIAAGIQHLKHRVDMIGVLIMLGDMPQLDPGTVKILMDAFLADRPHDRSPDQRVVAPYYRGQRGHPVVFGSAYLPALAQLRGDRGASALLHDLPVQRVDVDDPGVIRDIDTQDDLTLAGGAIDRRRDTPSRHAG